MAVAPEASSARAAADAAEHLFHEHSGWIYGYCLRVLRSPEEAEDALQTTYLNACRSLQQGTRPEAGSAWLLRIAQNVCFARLRSSGRRGKLERAQDITVLEETVAAPEPVRDELVGLTDALAALPERQREAILLREWQGLSYREVANRLGVTQASVETLIFRARRSLVEALENEGTRRRRSLHAFDLGGLLAAAKGFLAGGAGVKAVATLAVATATTATVVATDPVHVWSPERDAPTAAMSADADRPTAAAAAIAAPADGGAADAGAGPPTLGPAAGPALDPATVPTDPPAQPGPGEVQPGGPSTGEEHPSNSGGNGKGKAKGKADAPGQSPQGSLPPQSNGNGTPAGGKGVPASGKPDEAGEPTPPPQANGDPKAGQEEKAPEEDKAPEGEPPEESPQARGGSAD